MCGDSSSTFGELDVRLRRLATVLDDLGTSFGDRIAILAGNSDRYVELYCGVPASGRAIVPLNTRWAEPELAYALDDAPFGLRRPEKLALLREELSRLDAFHMAR